MQMYNMLFSSSVFFSLFATFVTAIKCDISQIHISQGKTPSEMAISWITPDKCNSIVSYGKNTEYLENYSYGNSSQYTFTYTLNRPPFYQSGYIHHVLLENLEPFTQYFYVCGDCGKNPLNFTTLPKVGNDKPISFGVIGDLGQTVDSVSTINHISNDKSIQMILHAGDLSYADCNQTLWDSYGQMIEIVSKRIPWMVCAGNHEIEFNGTNFYGLYTAFEKRYMMPSIKPAEFGDIIIPIETNPTNNLPYCTPSVFQSEYNYGNSFYSFEIGSAHIIFLNPYSNTSYTSRQYVWLKNNLNSLDRTVTPWVIIVMHCPWYSSNKNHYNDKQTIIMRDTMEDLFYKYSVNIVFSGHVHAYERTYPVFQNETDIYGTVYITIGDGGNLEGHDSTYYTQPKWSAFRNGDQFGHGLLTLLNRNKLQWRWYKNYDGQLIFKDELILCNSIFGKTTC